MVWITTRVALLSYLLLAANGTPIEDNLNHDLGLGFPFPFPFCTSTTTITLGGTYTTTTTSTVTSATSVVTVTAPPVVSTTNVRTTIYSPTEVSCISTATTFAPYPAPLGGLDARALAPTAAAVLGDCPTLPTITIIPPTLDGKECTRIDGDWDVTLKHGFNLPQQLIPVHYCHIPFIKSSLYSQTNPGINYYQYINSYNYNGNTDGLGGGGFDTADWNGNYSYYTSGLTRNIDFESPNWPSGPAVCQLPGQPAATDCNQWTVVFQGFIYAKEAGTYTVFAPTPNDSPNWQDNSGFWWGGEKAYSEYANDNVDGGAAAIEINGVSNSFEYTLVAGEFLPMTFIYSNGQGPAANRISITSPDGTQYPANLDLFVPPCADSPFVP
ncbi:hypothetical protein FQN54_003765 [Arachnomyces sp. PD_36]|nr:hypothetical protein FQN54_003765 [Arachnomyces sp. PD_36]